LGVKNIFDVYMESTDWERDRGLMYYDWQKDKILKWTRDIRLPIENKIAAFCVLSPNNSEKTTYKDLSRCVKIVRGILPPNTKLAAYPANREKALRVLRGENPLHVVGGKKVTAFYFNTLDPNDESHITVDGHLFGIWKGTYHRMRDVPYLTPTLYNRISDDLREVARIIGIPAPRLQSIVWITWKRKHRVLANQQFQLEFNW
jgi:hypothetical protein